MKGFEAAAGPWAAASAGCFDHGGAVSVSFCSRGSSRAAGRPPWGPALPRPSPVARTREGGRGDQPGCLQSPPKAPSSPPAEAPRAAASCWGGGRRPAGPSCRLAAGPGGWAPCQGVLGTAAPQPLLSAAHPARPPDSLTHPTHAHSWPEAMLRSGGGRAGRRARTGSAGSRARRHARAHAGHTRAHYTHTRMVPAHTA